MTSVSNILLSAGLICLVIGGYLIWERTNPYRLSFDFSNNNQIEVLDSTPIRIIIKDTGINLKVFPSTLNNKTWESTSRGVSYLIDSSIPGEVGNSVFYGHNWPNLLGNLKDVKKGQEITIYSQNGPSKTFIIDEITTVSSNQIDILNPSHKRLLTLFTCASFLDSKRLVVKAVEKTT